MKLPELLCWLVNFNTLLLATFIGLAQTGHSERSNYKLIMLRQKVLLIPAFVFALKFPDICCPVIAHV